MIGHDHVLLLLELFLCKCILSFQSVLLLVHLLERLLVQLRVQVQADEPYCSNRRQQSLKPNYSVGDVVV